MSAKETGNRPVSFNFSKNWPWVTVAIIILFVAAIRIRLLQIPLERDEGEFAYMGQLMLQGIPPYSIAYNMKLPGIYAAYALLMAIFGQTTAGVHLGLLLVNATAIVLLFLLTRRLFDNIAAVVASASYALLSLSPTVLGTSAHATQFIVPLALGGTILLLRALDSGKNWHLFASGLLYGLAFLVKQHAIFFIAFALFYFLWTVFRMRPLRAKRLATGSALLVIASAIPFIVTCILLYAAGSFANFWFWTFRYGIRYVSEVPLSDAAKNFKRIAPMVMKSWEWIWAIAGIGLTAIIWNKAARSKWPFWAGMTAFSFLSICPSFHFRNHYFITVLPIVAMLAGIAVGALMQILSGRRVISAAMKILPILIMAAALIYPIIESREFFFQANPLQASRMLYGISPFPESLEIAKYIRSHTTSDDRIAIFGSEPQICFYAGRKSATGYIYVYALMEIQDFASRMQLELIREIEKTHPRYAVIVNVTNSWTPKTNSDTTVFRWAESYFRETYRVTGLIDIMPDGHFQAYWDDEARRNKPQSQSYLYVLERIRE